MSGRVCVSLHPSVWGPKSTSRRGAHTKSVLAGFVFSRLRAWQRFSAWAWTCPRGPYIAAWVFSFVWEGPLQFAPANCSPRSWPEKTQRRGETLRVGTRDRHPRKPQTLHTQWRPFLHTLHTAPEAAWRHEDQSKNGATGPEIRVRWGEYHAGNAGESRLAVRCLLDDPMPTCAKTRNRQLHHQGGLIRRT